MLAAGTRVDAPDGTVVADGGADYVIDAAGASPGLAGRRRPPCPRWCTTPGRRRRSRRSPRGGSTGSREAKSATGPRRRRTAGPLRSRLSTAGRNRRLRVGGGGRGARGLSRPLHRVADGRRADRLPEMARRPLVFMRRAGRRPRKCGNRDVGRGVAAEGAAAVAPLRTAGPRRLHDLESRRRTLGRRGVPAAKSRGKPTPRTPPTAGGLGRQGRAGTRPNCNAFAYEVMTAGGNTPRGRAGETPNYPTITGCWEVCRPRPAVRLSLPALMRPQTKAWIVYYTRIAPWQAENGPDCNTESASC